MQAPNTDPAKPIDPSAPTAPTTSAPKAADPAAIPELGVAGKATTTSGKAVSPEDRSTQFVAVQGGGNTTSAEALLVAGYMVMWALLLGFVFLTWRRQQRMESRMVDLERALARAEGASTGPSRQS